MLKLLGAWLILALVTLSCLTYSQHLGQQVGETQRALQQEHERLKKLEAQLPAVEELRARIHRQAEEKGWDARAAAQRQLLQHARAATGLRSLEIGASGWYLECDASDRFARQLGRLPGFKTVENDPPRVAARW